MGGHPTRSTRTDTLEPHATLFRFSRNRDAGAPNGVIAHSLEGKFDVEELVAMARGWAGLEGMDLAKDVSRTDTGDWTGGIWALGKGYQTPFASSAVEMPIGSAGPHGEIGRASCREGVCQYV